MAERPMHADPAIFQKLVDLYAQGEARIDAKDFEGAIKTFTEGIGIDDHFRQRYITMYAQRAYAHQVLGHLKEAIADYTKAIELETPPENRAQYYFQRGMAWQNLPTETDADREKHFQEALNDFGHSIELYQENAGPFHLRGKLLVNEYGKYEEGIPDLTKALSMTENVDLYQVRGYAYLNLNKLSEAQADFERAVSLSDEPDAYSQYMLAVLASKAGDIEKVIEHARISLNASPDFRSYFAEHEDFEEARKNSEFAKLLEEAA